MVQARSRDRARKPRRRLRLKRFGEEFCEPPTRDAGTLRQIWKAQLGADPSPRLGRSLMIRAISYRIQERALAASSWPHGAFSIAS